MSVQNKMPSRWWGRFAVLAFLSVMSVVYVVPTALNLDPLTTKFPFKQKINLGLDLQGGLYMVLGVDFNKVYTDVIDRQTISLRDRLKELNLPVTEVKTLKDGQPADDSKIQITFDAAKRTEIYDLIKKEFWSLRFSEDKPGEFQLGISGEYRNEIREKTIGQSIEVIRNRIDEFGVSEPSIASQGTDRIVVELPGIREIDRAKELIGRTAKLQFKMVDDENMAKIGLGNLVAEAEKTGNITFKEGDRFSEYVTKINDALKSKVPEDTEVAFERSGESRQPYLLKKVAGVTGEDLQDANVQMDSEKQMPVVGFSLNAKGASAFERITSENIGKRMAITLDGIVHSAPVIQGKIPGGHGQITLGRGNYEATLKEAKDLSIVLRAGALPAQLDFLEQRVVGPSLGQDSIRKGVMAAVFGSLAVLLLVSIYYRGAGLIAAFSLILNVLFVVATLVGLDATLTLPGIAGIALTVGIAVDSNIVIFERIREEIRHGKSNEGSVEAGFQKAFRTILDANVTNAAAAIVLLVYGTGPIKGFAVTMLIGIVTTIITAVFVCRVLFDLYINRLEQSRKPISI